MTSPYQPAPSEPTPEPAAGQVPPGMPPAPPTTDAAVPAQPTGGQSPYLQQQAPVAPGYQQPYAQPGQQPYAQPGQQQPYYPQPGQQAYGVPRPVRPITGPPSPTSAIIRGGVGLLLILGGVLSQVFGAGFPSNAPVEMFINFGLSVTMIAGGIALGIFAVLGATNPTRANLNRLSPLAITSIVLVAIALLATLTSIPEWMNGLGGGRMRYMNLSGGIFYAGAAWITGVVMAALSLRTQHTTSRLLSWIALVVGLLLIIPTVIPVALYGASITD